MKENNKNTRETQVKQIKDLLLRGEKIDMCVALEKYGCFRLPAIIYLIKKQYHYPIETNWIMAGGVRCKEYYIKTFEETKNEKKVCWIKGTGADRQIEKIYELLKQGFELTKLSAYHICKCVMLSSRICEIKQKYNVQVNSKWIKLLNGKKVKCYYL